MLELDIALNSAQTIRLRGCFSLKREVKLVFIPLPLAYLSQVNEL